MSTIFLESLIDLDLSGSTKVEAIASLAALAVDAGRATSLDGLVADVLAREEIAPTGFEGVAIPHARSAHCTASSVVVGRQTRGIDFGGDDGDVKLVFMIVAPADGHDEHLEILAALARRILDEQFRLALMSAVTAADALQVLSDQPDSSLTT
jgi:fructose-specific phosphotransferase system IIA component